MEEGIIQAGFASTLTSLDVTIVEGVFNLFYSWFVASALANAKRMGKETNSILKGKGELTDLMQTFLDNTNYASIMFPVNYWVFKNNRGQGNIILTKISYK